MGVGDPRVHENRTGHEDEAARLPRHPALESALRRRIEQPPVEVEGHDHVVLRQFLGRGRKGRQDSAGVLRAALAGSAQDDVDRHALVAFEHVPHELVFATRAASQEQHLRDPVDHLDLGHLPVVGRRAVGSGRNHPHGQITTARRRQARHVEPHGDEFATGSQHGLGGVDHAARCRGGLRIAPRGVAGRHFGEFHADRLACQSLGLQVGRHGKTVARKHAGRHEQVGDTHIRRQAVGADADCVHGHARLAERRHRRRGINAGVVRAVGQHDHTGKHAGRLLIEHPRKRFTQSRFIAAGREPIGPCAGGRRHGRLRRRRGR